MNWDIVKGNAKSVKSQLKQKWAKLTDDDLLLVEGKAEDFFGRLQQRLGLKRDEIEAEMDRMIQGVDQTQKKS